MSLLVEPRDRSFSQRDPSVHHSETGLAVLDPDLVGVNSSEKHPDSERKRSRGGGGDGSGVERGGIGSGDAHVLNPHLLEIKLGFLRLDGEDDDEDDGEDKES